MARDMVDTPYGPIAPDYRCARLTDVCVPDGGIQTGPFGSQLHMSDYVTHGTPIITVEHLGDNRIIHRDLPRVTDSDKERLSRYSLRPGDIVFSRVGSVDLRALVREEESDWLFSGRLIRVRPDRGVIDPGYLSWFFGLPAFREYVRRIAYGATMPSLNTQLMSDLPVCFPSLATQCAIAHILGTLDDKIELNRRMNATLEGIARAIFRSWFVDFDPVRAKAEGRDPGLPKHLADLFPDRFVASELGEIPEGWRVRPISGILELAYGKALKADARETGNVPVYGSNGQIGWHSHALAPGPGIVVGRKGNPGVVTWSPTGFYPIDTTFYVIPKRPAISMRYLYHALRLLNLQALAADSAVPGLNRHMVYMTQLTVPPTEVMCAFDQQVQALSARVQHSHDESAVLAALRDTLLPKLISGELRVPDAEHIVGEQA